MEVSTYFLRKIEPILLEYMAAFPVIGLMGPRQAGKSTLLRHLLPDYRYVTFDDHRHISLFEEDPHQFIELYSENVIFDEVQKMPKLFDLIKLTVDQNRKPGRYILTGSSQFLLHQSITESLAGRIGLLQLLPFQYSEIPDEAKSASIYRGGYPELVTRQYTYSDLWYSSYVDTYLTKDVRQLFNVIDLNDFRRFLSLAASRTAQVVDLSEMANSLDVSVPTINRWISILEASYIVFLIKPYHQNLGKRLTKRPKLYFYDTGLVSYLTGISTFEQYNNGPLAGALFETYMVSEIVKKETHKRSQVRFFYFRSSDAKEIDLILESPHTTTFIEIKKSHTFKPEMTRIIQTLLPPNATGMVIYSGENYPTPRPISVLNYRDYLK